MLISPFRLNEVNREVAVDDFDGHWEVRVALRKIQPGASIWTSEPLHIGATSDMEVMFDGRIFADNIQKPIEISLCVNVQTIDVYDVDDIPGLEDD